MSARRVELVEHRPEWKDAAAAESQRLKDSLVEIIVDIHHIGSTAVPGIAAKPVLDLLPLVRSAGELDLIEERIAPLGYRCHGEFGIDGRRYFTLDDSATNARLVQLHGFVTGHPQAERMLRFCELLKSDPELAKQYEREKFRCRALHPGDTVQYAMAKTDWIAAVLRDDLRRNDRA